MNEKSSSSVGRWIESAACSGVSAPNPTMAIAPRSATPVRSSCRNGSPPRIIPAYTTKKIAATVAVMGTPVYPRCLIAMAIPKPPIEPMLAKSTQTLPAAGDFLYEPKWDGFRALVFRDGGVYIQSRDLRPLDRYFPDLHDVFERALPKGCVVDGEIVIAKDGGLDFDALQLRLHPAASRVAMLAKQDPASFVAFDLLAVDNRDLRGKPLAERRAALEKLLARAKPPIHLTPAT